MLQPLLLTLLGAAGTGLGGLLVVLQPSMDFRRLGALQVCDAGWWWVGKARGGARRTRTAPGVLLHNSMASSHTHHDPRACVKRPRCPCLLPPHTTNNRAWQQASCSAYPS
jgi:hypothetical protein